MSKQIKIRVYPDGRIESETVNIKGKECLEYLKETENLTGAKIEQSSFTSEYYKSEQQVSYQAKGYQYNEYKN